MIRVMAIGDLHVDNPKNAEAPELIRSIALDKNVDVLMILGDVSHNAAELESALRIMNNSAEHCLFVPGNHDIWLSNDEEKEAGSLYKYKSSISKICENSDFKHLGINPVIIDNVGFFGSIGWYDYTFRNPKSEVKFNDEEYERKRYRGRTWMDRKHALWHDSNRGKLLKDREVLNLLIQSLKEQFESVAGARLRRAVTGLHHLPSSSLLKWTGQADWDYFGAFMGSERLMEEILEGYSTLLPNDLSSSMILSAHIHRKRRAVHDGVKLATACIGQPRERETGLYETIIANMEISDI